MRRTTRRVVLIAAATAAVFLPVHGEPVALAVAEPEFAAPVAVPVARHAIPPVVERWLADQEELLARQGPGDDEDTTTTTPTRTTTTTTTTTTSTTAPPTSTTPPPTSTTRTTNSRTTESRASSSDSSSTTEPSLIVVTQTRLTTTSSTPTETNTDDDDSDGLKGSTIIGLGVAGGIALLAIVGFLVWKVTRKKLNDFNGDGEIKWPELNNDTHALPVRTGGRSGIDSSPPPRDHPELYSDSASHAPSDQYTQSQDPYAVPPLPHMNPNQTYRDDPYGPQPGPGGAFYDPYRGPVPNSFQGGAPPQGGDQQQWGMQGGEGYEAYPMGTYPPQGRTRSPGPAAAYGGYDYDAGGPGAGPGQGRQSPGPNAAYGQQPAAGGAGYGGYPQQQHQQHQQYPQHQQGYGQNNRQQDDDPYGGIS